MTDDSLDIPPELDRRKGRNPERQAAAEADAAAIAKAKPDAPKAPRLSAADRDRAEEIEREIRAAYKMGGSKSARTAKLKKLRRELASLGGKPKKVSRSPRSSKPKPAGAIASARAEVKKGEPSKGDLVLEHIHHGCTADELISLTGWAPHTLRAFISVQNRAHKLGIVSERKDGVTHYSVPKAAS